MNEEHEDQALDATYRRASAQQAGRPNAGTRAAILAQAAAAARPRTPAANDSRYLMRAIAGIAVIGVGVLVWRQTDHRLPGEAPSLEVPVAQPAAESARNQAFVPDPDAPPPQPEVPATQELAPRREALLVPAAPAPRVAPATSGDQADLAQPQPQAAPRPAPPPESLSARATAPDEIRSDESDELQEVQVTGARVLRERRTVGPRDNVPAPAGGAAAPATPPETRVEPDAGELLSEYFPAQNQSATPRRLWLVRDADGVVLDAGELGPREQLASQIPAIRRALNLRELVPGPVQSVPNARGQVIELTILEAR